MSCDYCNDKGWYWVANGPDDVDKEPCDCAMAESTCKEPDEDVIRESVRQNGTS